MSGPVTMSGLVSCIVPTRNGERHLAETIRSILAQTYRPIEAIVVNDESSDRTVEIAEGFGSPVRVISQKRGGPAAARNLGMEVAGGAFFAFLDHDDLWDPQKLKLQIAAFVMDPGLDVCVGHVRRFAESDNGGRVYRGDAVPGYVTITMLARRSAFERVGGLNPEQYHSDSAEWFLRARELGLRVHLLPETVTYHRQHDMNRSLRNGDRSRDEFLHLIKAKLDRNRGGADLSLKKAGGS